MAVSQTTYPLIICTETTWGQHATIISGEYDANHPESSDMSVQENATVKDYRGNTDGMNYLVDHPDSISVGSIFFNMEDSTFYTWTGVSENEWAPLFGSGE